MNVSNKDKLILRDLPADEIKGLFNSDSLQELDRDNWKAVLYTSNSTSSGLCGNVIYRTKPQSPQEQLESEKARVINALLKDCNFQSFKPAASTVVFDRAMELIKSITIKGGDDSE